MAYYNTCRLCGSNLDPGEVCDCKATPAQAKQANPKDKRQEKTKRKDLPKRKATAV